MSRRVWVAPAADLTPEGLLDLVLDDAYAYLDGLERRKGSLLDAPTLLSLSGLGGRPGGSRGRREAGPVRLSLKLDGFSPEDVAVRLDGRRLQVTAKKETQRRAPDGCCARDAREVYREVLLPDDADLEALACALHADGQLRIEAPRLPPPERVVPIQRMQEAVEGAAGGEEMQQPEGGKGTGKETGHKELVAVAAAEHPARAMPSLCRRMRLSPAASGCSPAELCGWKTVPTLDGFLERVLGDAHAQLEALQRGGRVLLLDRPALRSRGRREAGPVRLSLDLAGFSPEDVVVRLDGRRLQVTARKESQRRAPDGCCARDAREVYREVLLPDDADLEALACALNPDGQLRIEAPRLPPPPPPERVVPIQRLEAAVGEEKQVRDGGEEKAAEGEE
ncbi:UNVERIFIED_CONTAM: hypothetical protein K2H54_005384 [Gekko kuhli]